MPAQMRGAGHTPSPPHPLFPSDRARSLEPLRPPEMRAEEDGSGEGRSEMRLSTCGAKDKEDSALLLPKATEAKESL